MDKYNPNRSMEMELKLRRAIDALREGYDDYSDYTNTINGMLGDNDVNDPDNTSLMLEGISNVVDLIREERNDDDPLVKAVDEAVTEWGNYLGRTFEVDSINDTESMDKVQRTLSSLIERARKLHRFG